MMSTAEANESHTAFFAFPGIGMELCGTEAGFVGRHAEIAGPIFEAGSAAAGLALDISLRANAFSQLSERQQQILIFCLSAVMADVLDKTEIRPVKLAGFSFGVYAALYATGALSFAQALSLLIAAYDIMERRCRGGDAGMLAVVGLNNDELSAMIADAGLDSLCCVNNLNALCHVLCGRCAQLSRAEELCRRADAISVVRFAVSLPYHHPELAKPALPEFSAAVEACSWQAPQVPLLSTIDQQELATVAALKRFVVAHLSRPIDWYATTRVLHANPAPLIVECGPGIALTQNARFVAGGSGRWINSKNILARLGL
jgi:[acyl-carrier-protein] S-malonyltransferase